MQVSQDEHVQRVLDWRQQDKSSLSMALENISLKVSVAQRMEMAMTEALCGIIVSHENEEHGQLAFALLAHILATHDEEAQNGSRNNSRKDRETVLAIANKKDLDSRICQQIQ